MLIKSRDEIVGKQQKRALKVHLQHPRRKGGGTTFSVVTNLVVLDSCILYLKIKKTAVFPKTCFLPSQPNGSPSLCLVRSACLIIN